MLKNKTDKEVKIQYNQKTITVAKKGSLDVREFGVKNDEVLQVEKHILAKNPNVFNQEKTEDIIETNKEAVEKVEALENEVSDLKKKLEAAQKGADSAKEKMDKVLVENSGLKKTNDSLKKEKAELAAKLKAAS